MNNIKSPSLDKGLGFYYVPTYAPTFSEKVYSCSF